MRLNAGIGMTLKATPIGLCLLKRKRSQTQACNTNMWSYPCLSTWKTAPSKQRASK
jgi:hypothetical protein